MMINSTKTNDRVKLYWVKNIVLILSLSLLLLLAVQDASAYGEIIPVENAENYLSIATYDGSGQGCHPDIIYLPQGWNGYKYLMVFTAYTDSDASTEWPHLVVSNDGTSFAKIASSNDRIISTLPSGYEFGHWFDPCIEIVNGRLWLYITFGSTVPDFSATYRTSTLDGITWTTIEQTDINAGSPSVEYENGVWKLWGEHSPNMVYYTSVNGVNFTEVYNKTIDTGDYTLWHLNVQPGTGGYEMIASCADEWNRNSLLYLYSSDGINWILSHTTPFLTRSKEAGWDNQTIYETAFLDDGNNNYRIWYSASDSIGRWHIGYTTTYGDPYRIVDYTTPDPITTGLVGFWDNSLDVEPTVEDISGNNYDGTNVQSTLIQLPSGAYARQYDSSNDRVTIPTNDAINFTSSFTLEALVYIPATSTSGYIITKGPSSFSSSTGYSLYYSSSNNAIYFTYGNGALQQVYTASGVDEDKWNHITATYDATIGNLTLFIDNHVVTKQITAGALVNSNRALLFGNDADKYHPFVCTIAYVRAYDIAFNLSMANQNFESEAWRVNYPAGLSSPTFSDYEGDNINITVALSGPAVYPTTVYYNTTDGTASEGTDYTNISGVVYFYEGEQSKNITVPTNMDGVVSGQKTFSLTLSDPIYTKLNASTTCTANMLEANTVSITMGATQTTLTESNTNITITLTKNGTTAFTESIDVITLDGSASAPSDFTALSETVSFAAGEYSKTVVLSIKTNNNNYNYESYFQVLLSNPTGNATLGSPSALTITILGSPFEQSNVGIGNTIFDTYTLILLGMGMLVMFLVGWFLFSMTKGEHIGNYGSMVELLVIVVVVITVVVLIYIVALNVGNNLITPY